MSSRPISSWLLIVSIFLFVFFSILSIRFGYPYVYLVGILLLPWTVLSFKYNNPYAKATLAIFLGISISHHAHWYLQPDMAHFLNLNVEIERIYLSSNNSRSFAINDTLWVAFINNFPFLIYLLPLSATLLTYISLRLLFAELGRGHVDQFLCNHKCASDSALILVMAVVGLFGFVPSFALAILAMYYLVRSKKTSSLLFLVLSVTFGSRGLIALGVPYVLTFIKVVSRRYLILFVLLGLGIVVAMFQYVTGYTRILMAFYGAVGDVNFTKLLDALLNFIFRERLQPWHDFIITSTAYVITIALGIYYGVRLRLYLWLLNIFVLLSLFGITFIGRISIFENPASDIPYYFLLAAVINSVIVLAISRVRWVIPAILVVFIAISTFPKYNFSLYYEHDFNQYQQYHALLVYIRDYGVNTKFVYDYGSFKFSRFIPNGNLLQPWQSPSRHFSGRYYIYSTSIYTREMFFTLPHIRSELISIAKNNVVFNTGQYRISPIKP